MSVRDIGREDEVEGVCSKAIGSLVVLQQETLRNPSRTADIFQVRAPFFGLVHDMTCPLSLDSDFIPSAILVIVIYLVAVIIAELFPVRSHRTIIKCCHLQGLFTASTIFGHNTAVSVAHRSVNILHQYVAGISASVEVYMQDLRDGVCNDNVDTCVQRHDDHSTKDAVPLVANHFGVLFPAQLQAAMMYRLAPWDYTQFI